MSKTHAFGVDLGGTTVKMGLFKMDGTLVEKWEIPTRTENQGDNILPDIAESIAQATQRHGLSQEDIAGVGMGVPGAVLEDRYVKPCVNLNQWGGNVAERLESLCGLPVKVVNDANAAALGEMGMGGGKGCRNLVFVTLGTGVGGGIIVDGKLLSGVHGAGGEIGHIKVESEKDCPHTCGCGRRGCLEQYASATGIVRMAQERLVQLGDTTLRNYENLTCKDIFQCAQEGDSVADELVEKMAEYLGRALAGVSCVCDPEIIVVGGGVAKAGTFLLDKIQEKFRKYAFPAAMDTPFALAELGNDAGICGGVQMILN